MQSSPIVAQPGRPAGHPLRMAQAICQLLLLVVFVVGATVALPTALAFLTETLMAAFGAPTGQ